MMGNSNQTGQNWLKHTKKKINWSQKTPATLKTELSFICLCPFPAAYLVAVTQMKPSTVLALSNLFRTKVSH